MRTISPNPYGSSFWWRLRVLAVSIAFALGSIRDLLSHLIFRKKREGKSDQYW